ncbi:MAG: gliding motility protein GldL [Saprospiraceae bacterium]|nr:gliding motility protein GldL [Saprospiraceae bacterium]
MAFYKSNWFKYLKNLIIGVGASLVMIGALGKINSEPWGGIAITIGLVTEAFLFLILGLLPPEKDYYWDKLYPGLGDYASKVGPIGGLATNGASSDMRQLDGEKVETQLNGMLDELRGMSKSLGSLKALQEVDFSSTAQQVKTMNNFYNRLNEAMAELHDTVDDTKEYRDHITTLNRNLGSLNTVYGNMLNAMSNPVGRQV